MKQEQNNANDPGNKFSGYHVPVLLEETIELLDIKPDGIYVDCTFGGGGHSKAILHRLSAAGKLVAFDQDEDARNNLPGDPRVLFIPHNFRHLQRFLRLHGIENVHGILADLGVSSHQFDEAERGFSTRFDSDLDMRMDRRQEKTASQILNTYSSEQLQKILSEYGEVTNARTLAQRIVSIRTSVSLKTVNDFKQAISKLVKGNPNKYLAQVFQALRIEVNDEMGSLRELLQQIPLVLTKGGRAAVISFHSIEDRMVKNFFRRGSFEDEEKNPFTMTEEVATMKPVNKKPVIASAKEIKNNPRSRSAKLRAAERI